MTPHRRSTPPMPVRGNGGTTIEHDVDLSALTDADFRWLYQITAAHEGHPLMVWLRDHVTEEIWRRGGGAPKKLARLSIGEWGYEALAKLIELMPTLRSGSMGPDVPAASAVLMATLDAHVADLASAVVGGTGGAIADVARAMSRSKRPRGSTLNFLNRRRYGDCPYDHSRSALMTKKFRAIISRFSVWGVR